MKYLIVGRTGSGKDFLAKKLSELGLTQVKSYATRPKRTEDEDGHIFISKDEAAAMENKIARVDLGEYEYFALPEQVMENDIYIVEPSGVFEVADACPTETFHLIYVWADKLERRIHAVKRADDPIKEEERFQKREDDEDATFKDFEKMIEEDGVEQLPDNITTLYHVDNNYQPEDFEEAVNVIKSEICLRKNIQTIIDYHINKGNIEVDDKGYIKDAVRRNGEIISVTKEHYTDTIISDQDTFTTIIKDYLSNIEIPTSSRVQVASINPKDFIVRT